MSPLEVAKAFGAPLLAAAGSNENAAEILNSLDTAGVEKLRYGVKIVKDDTQGNGDVKEEGSVEEGFGRLGFDRAENVRMPQGGARYL